MHSDLVRTAGFQPAPNMAKAGIFRQHLHMGNSVAAVFLGHTHLFAVGFMPADRCIHGKLPILKMPVNYCFILPCKAVGLYLLGQVSVGGVILGHDQQPTGILIDAMHNTGAYLSIDSGKAVPAVIQQGIHQRAGIITCRRVNHHSLGLIHYQQVVVLIYDLQRDILGLGAGGYRVRQGDDDTVTLPQGVLLPCRSAVFQDTSLFRQRLYLAAGKLRHQ